MSRIDAVMAFENPDEVRVKLTLTMSLADWKAMKAQMTDQAFPSWRVRNMITDLVAATEARAHEQKEMDPS